MTIKCPKCLSENPDSQKFCGECATPLPSAADIGLTQTMETPYEELTMGTTFAGRYQIIEELGKGGMGKVYRVLDKKLNEEVALKLIKAEIASDRKTLERFKNELKLARKVSQKHVGRMFDMGEEKGIHYITMEYVPGEDLKSFIRRVGRIPIGKSIAIAKQVCEGLVEAHNIGIVHRDLKPSNIMIDRNGNAKIMDFGIARTIKGKKITGSGVMIGTPQYMSPEQVEGKEVDVRSDIYSLGVILYEMLTDRVPFDGDTPLSVGVKQKTKKPKDPKDLNERIPEEFNRLILKCLEKEKENRYQNVDELKSDLEKLERGLPTTEKSKPRTKPLTSREITVKFNLRKMLIPALLFVVLSAVALFLIFAKNPGLETNKIVVTTFLNQTGDLSLAHVGRMAAEEISQGLRRISSLEVAPVTDISLGSKTRIESQHLRRIVKDTKAAIVISGEYYLQGENLLFRANVYDAAEQKMAPSPDSVSGDKKDLSEAFSKLRSSLSSLALSIHDPRIKMWFVFSTYIPKFEALIECIKGIELFFRFEIEESYKYFDRAAEIDPHYHLPLAMAAINNSSSKQAQYLERMEQIPNLSQGEKIINDWFRARLDGDNESMFRAIQKQDAIAPPGTAHTYQLSVDALDTNRPHTAIEALKRLDPESVYMADWIFYWGQMTWAYHMIGAHKKELKAAIRAQKQYPESWTPLFYKINALAALGKIKKIKEVIEESRAKPLMERANPAILAIRAGEEFKAHGYDEEAAEMFDYAMSWLENRPQELIQNAHWKFSLARVYTFTQNYEKAMALFRDLLKNMDESSPNYAVCLGSLGFAAAMAGDREEAIRISEFFKNWARPYLFGKNSYWQAVIAAVLGNKDQAMTLLRTSISQGQAYDSLYCSMELEPLWDHPAFIGLLKPRD